MKLTETKLYKSTVVILINCKPSKLRTHYNEQQCLVNTSTTIEVCNLQSH